jgi:hypothetical protein
MQKGNASNQGSLLGIAEFCRRYRRDESPGQGVAVVYG